MPQLALLQSQDSSRPWGAVLQPSRSLAGARGWEGERGAGPRSRSSLSQQSQDFRWRLKKGATSLHPLRLPHSSLSHL